MGKEVLKVQDLQKSFGGLRAIDALSFAVTDGQIKSIIGPNGAGKTTLFNLITGIFPPSGGTFQFAGKNLNGLKPHDIARLGISRTFQNLELFPNMNVLENVMVGGHNHTCGGIFQAGFRLPGMRKEERRIRENALEELRFMELENKAAMGATSLPLGDQKLLEIADADKKVYLVERTPSIGGHMAQLDKTFPTLDCSSCILTPKMTLVGSHPYIDLMTYSEVEEISGYIGNFTVKIRKKARYVDAAKCTGCGICQTKCPFKADNEFEAGIGQRKAIYTPFPQAVPNVPVIDAENCAFFLKGTCRACEKFCDAGAIDFEQKEKVVEVDVGNIIVASGFDSFDPSVMLQFGYGKYDNVITGIQFERMSNASGPTDGKIVLKDGSPPHSVAILHCIGR